MDPAAAQKIVSAFDAELERRRRRKYDTLVTKWREDSDNDAIYVFCRSLEWQKANGLLPNGFFAEPSDLGAVAAEGILRRARWRHRCG
jgi:hypothetical protein